LINTFKIEIFKVDSSETTTYDGLDFRFIDIVCNNNYFLILRNIYEGAELATTYYLVNVKNGQTIELLNIPVFSPDKKKLLVFDRFGQDTEPLIMIVNITSEKYKTELTLFPKQWEPTDVKWINSSKIKIDRVQIENKSLPTPIFYKFNGVKWTLSK
jgi:hypothetical protein